MKPGDSEPPGTASGHAATGGAERGNPALFRGSCTCSLSPDSWFISRQTPHDRPGQPEVLALTSTAQKAG